jgi:hypothetical protein
LFNQIKICTLVYQSTFQISVDIKQETRAVHFDYSVFLTSNKKLLLVSMSTRLAVSTLLAIRKRTANLIFIQEYSKNSWTHKDKISKGLPGFLVFLSF